MKISSIKNTKLTFLLTSLTLSTLIFSISHAKTPYSAADHKTSFTYLTIQDFHGLKLTPTHNSTNPIYTKSPTLAYSAVPNFNKHTLHDEYFDNIENKIKKIGSKKIEKIINKIVKKELEYSKDHIIFYHAQKREFIVLQDIYKKLYETFNNTIVKDFLFLRIPNPAFDQFETTQDFISHYKFKILNHSYPFNVFDNDPQVNSHILSTNISLFGNTLSSLNKDISECTFKYFIKSKNITNVDIMNLCKEMFELFKLSSHTFEKYKPQLQNLISLLSENEIEKTGILLQIFVPKNWVNKITYRANRGGTPFYGISTFFSWGQPTSLEILESYTKDVLSLLNSTITLMNPKLNELDMLEYRILMTNKEMLNPYCGIKIFRYTTKTLNMQLYKQELKKLVQEIIDSKQNDLSFKEIFTNALKYFATVVAIPYFLEKLKGN